MLNAKEIQKDFGSEVADRLLKTANFNKGKIRVRLIFLKETGDVWEY